MKDADVKADLSTCSIHKAFDPFLPMPVIYNYTDNNKALYQSAKFRMLVWAIALHIVHLF